MVEQAGSVAGFAAVLGLAVLSALYFSQARDLRRLREWAGRAPERAAEGQPGAVVPGRVVAVPQQPPRPAQPPPPATPAGATPAQGNGAPADADADKAAEGEKQAEPAASNGDAAPAVKAGEGEAAESKDGAPPAKPGMPAPASAAAAAAGAGAKSVAGPAAPGSAPAAPGSTPPEGQPGAAPAGPPGSASPGAAPPGSPPAGAPGGKPGSPASAPGGPPPGKPATPQRTPGSVLPPRTGSLPPVRRLPAANAPGPAGGPPQKKRNPVYVVLAVAGVLILGAGAAVGVPALVNGSKDDATPSAKKAAKKKTSSSKKATRVAPNSITVAVLNGTSIPGLAAQVADRVDAEGFSVGTISNASPASGQRANSVAMYASGHKADAEQVAKQLSIRNISRIDANSQSIAGDASVVVIVGTDKTQ